MKKTVFSVSSLLLVSGMLASTALAVFLPTGRFTGMEFRTSNLSLLVDADYYGPGDFREEHTLPGVARLYPGMDPFEEDFLVQNASDQGQALAISGSMIPGNQDWSTIKDVIVMSVYSHENGETSPEYSLAEWSEATHAFPYATINANTTQGYQLRFRMLEQYPEDPDGDGPLTAGSAIGSELMNKVAQNTVFEISGTPTESR